MWPLTWVNCWAWWISGLPFLPSLWLSTQQPVWSSKDAHQIVSLASWKTSTDFLLPLELQLLLSLDYEALRALPSSNTFWTLSHPPVSMLITVHWHSFWFPNYHTLSRLSDFALALPSIQNTLFQVLDVFKSQFGYPFSERLLLASSHRSVLLGIFYPNILFILQSSHPLTQSHLFLFMC